MRIRTTLASPFGRKVRLAAIYLGFAPLEVVSTDLFDPLDSIRQDNPLGKIPAVTLDDGRKIYDSAIIMGYFDYLSGGRLFPSDPLMRLETQQNEALCDGILDAGVAIVMERRMRPMEMQSEEWIKFQSAKIDRGLTKLASIDIDPHVVNTASIAKACTLDWLDFRQLADWRLRHRQMIEWLNAFSAGVPAYALTSPSDFQAS
jgi:glutathione S-transferase